MRENQRNEDKIKTKARQIEPGIGKKKKSTSRRKSMVAKHKENIPSGQTDIRPWFNFSIMRNKPFWLTLQD